MGAGEMAQKLRALTTPVEDPVQSQAMTLGSSQLSVTPVQLLKTHVHGIPITSTTTTHIRVEKARPIP